MLQDIDLRYDRTGALTTSKSLKVGGALTVGGTPVTAPAVAQPSDHGLISWSTDPAHASTTTNTVSGTLYLAAVFIRASATTTKIWWIHTTAGVTPTAGQNFAGLYSSTGTLLASVGIDTQAGANGVQSATITSTALNPGFYWVGLLFNAATAPIAARAGGQSVAANNMNLTPATYRYATNGTGLTAMPASITPSSNSLTGASALAVAIS